MQAYEITQKHGREMYAIGLKHALELAKIYADAGRTLPELVELLQEKLDEETENGTHDRFDEEHRLICEDCTSAYFDFCQEQADDARLDAMINAEAGETEAQ